VSAPLVSTGAALWLVSLEEFTGRHVEDVAQRLDHVVLVRVEPTLHTLESVRGGHGDAAVAVERHAVRRQLFLCKQLRDSHTHVHNGLKLADGRNKSTLAVASTSIVRTLAVDYGMPEPLPVPASLPPDVAAIDASFDPLCMVCRASFREPAGLLCAACRSERSAPQATEHAA
jgi:hypothetical protein